MTGGDLKGSTQRCVAEQLCPCLQAVLSSGSHLIVGGEGVQPSVWDIAAGTKLWQAKGSKPHRQTLLVDKPFTTAVAFLPSSSSVSKDGETNQPLIAAADGEDEAAAVSVRFVAGSVSSKLHVYDTAAGRRPQSEVVFGETRITAVAPERDGEPAERPCCTRCCCLCTRPCFVAAQAATEQALPRKCGRGLDG